MILSIGHNTFLNISLRTVAAFTTGRRLTRPTWMITSRKQQVKAAECCSKKTSYLKPMSIYYKLHWWYPTPSHMQSNGKAMMIDALRDETLTLPQTDKRLNGKSISMYAWQTRRQKFKAWHSLQNQCRYTLDSKKRLCKALHLKSIKKKPMASIIIIMQIFALNAKAMNICANSTVRLRYYRTNPTKTIEC